MKNKKEIIIGIILGIAISFVTILLLTTPLPQLKAQQQTKYTVFKTENEGFKFLKKFVGAGTGRSPGETWLLAPIFAETPTDQSPPNQVATKEYVDKVYKSPVATKFYMKTVWNQDVTLYCDDPLHEMAIAGGVGFDVHGRRSRYAIPQYEGVYKGFKVKFKNPIGFRLDAGGSEGSGFGYMTCASISENPIVELDLVSISEGGAGVHPYSRPNVNWASATQWGFGKFDVYKWNNTYWGSGNYTILVFSDLSPNLLTLLDKAKGVKISGSSDDGGFCSFIISPFIISPRGFLFDAPYQLRFTVTNNLRFYNNYHHNDSSSMFYDKFAVGWASVNFAEGNFIFNNIKNQPQKVPQTWDTGWYAVHLSDYLDPDGTLNVSKMSNPSLLIFGYNADGPRRESWSCNVKLLF